MGTFLYSWARFFINLQMHYFANGLISHIGLNKPT